MITKNEKMNPKVDFYFEKEEKWKSEITQLRSTILSCELEEKLKWGCPCYTYQDSNIVLIHVFKEYCAVLFFKGVLLDNSHGLLIQQTENVQAARQMRFTSMEEVNGAKKDLINSIYEAIEVEKEGLKVPMKKTKSYDVPEEFEKILKENKELKAAFEALTPGRQRGYLLHFSQPKQSKTRVARIEKSMDDIFNGKGIND